MRDGIKTYEGSITINAYVDSNGGSPIIASSSSVFGFELGLPANYTGVTLPYEDIALVHVIPAPVGRGDVIFH